MNRTQKAESVEALKAELSTAPAIVATSITGISVNDVNEFPVSAVSDSMLTLKTKKGEQHFAVNSMTKKDGIATGQNVVVHYTMDGKTMVATGVMADASMTAKKK